MACSRGPIEPDQSGRRSEPSSENVLESTTYTKLHAHPPWNHPSSHAANPRSTPHLQSPSQHPQDILSHQELADFHSVPPAILEWTGNRLPQDPYRHLRGLNIGTKAAWVIIPAAEGSRILHHCKSMSTAASAAEGKFPCYNRETLFDEEWQAHMKDIHGVFLIWPETWVGRIEVLDLDAFGGDIVAVNEVVMDS